MASPRNGVAQQRGAWVGGAVGVGFVEGRLPGVGISAQVARLDAPHLWTLRGSIMENLSGDTPWDLGVLYGLAGLFGSRNAEGLMERGHLSVSAGVAVVQSGRCGAGSGEEAEPCDRRTTLGIPILVQISTEPWGWMAGGVEVSANLNKHRSLIMLALGTRIGDLR